MLGKTFKEVIEKRPSLLTDYKNKIKGNYTGLINRTFQPKSTQSLRNEISNTINTIGNIVDSLIVDNIAEIHNKLNETVDSLREIFASSVVSIKSTKKSYSLFEFLNPTSPQFLSKSP